MREEVEAVVGRKRWWRARRPEWVESTLNYSFFMLARKMRKMFILQEGK